MSDRATEVIEALQGTCDTLSDHATEEEQDDLEFLAEIDAAIFCCNSCGWWCDVSEMSEIVTDEQTCTDCEND